MYTELMKCTSRAMGPWRQRHRDSHAAWVSALAQLCIFETLTQRSMLWNGRPRRQIFCPGKQRSLWAVIEGKDSALDPLPEHHRGMGNGNREGPPFPRDTGKAAALEGSWNSEQPPELPPCSGAPTLDEVFSCQCLLHLNIFRGDPSHPFHTGMNILPLFPSEEMGLFCSLRIYCWRMDSSTADDHPYVGVWFPSKNMAFPKKGSQILHPWRW